MTQIIDGYKYSTDSATLLHEVYFGRDESDFRHYCEGLYRTSKGSLFLAGKGGPLSHYAVGTGDGCSGGQKITVVSEHEALIWCERHRATTTIETHFAHLVDEA